MSSLLEHGYVFEKMSHFRAHIKVIGVGGGGSNAVRHMHAMGIKDVDFIITNTDAQALESNPVQHKINIGNLGTGMNADAGREAALAATAEFEEVLKHNTDMLFITAGMGGGTGTGAAPVIAEIAHKLDILTVAIVTAPFGYEGRAKIQQAQKGIAELQKYCDTVLVVLNDKLEELCLDMTIDEAFSLADDVLAKAAKSIAEIITMSGKVNSDLNDVKTILKSAGQAVMGSATARGENRARICVEEALNSPLLDNRDIGGAKRVLATVAYSKEHKATIREQREIASYIKDKIDKEEGMEADLFKIGYVEDNSLEDSMRFTVIAAGFDLPDHKRHKEAPAVEKSNTAAPAAAEGTPALAEPVSDGAVAPAVEKKEPVFYVEDDSARLRRMYEEFMVEFRQPMTTERERELEQPAYQRHRVPLADLQTILSGRVERINMND
jgi:cell division protein FtsZ